MYATVQYSILCCSDDTYHCKGYTRSFVVGVILILLANMSPTRGNARVLCNIHFDIIQILKQTTSFSDIDIHITVFIHSSIIEVSNICSVLLMITIRNKRKEKVYGTHKAKRSLITILNSGMYNDTVLYYTI